MQRKAARTSCCVQPQAFLSALVGRARTEGYVPTRADLEAVLALGCTRDEILARYQEVGGACSERARALLGEIAR